MNNKAYYSPPWANTSIIGVAGSSGSGKTSLAIEMIKALSLPWVVILSMDSFYRPLNPEQSKKAFRNEFDFDSPDAIDFDVLVDVLRDLKRGRRAEVPIYSFERHQREERTSSIYSPHVLVLEGIFALYDPRVLELLDLKIFADADADLCLSRRIVRDLRDRGRDIEGCIKQWFSFVKPNFQRFVEPQRQIADVIIPRGIENRVAIDMIVQHIKRILSQKSKEHQEDLLRLGKQVEDEPLSEQVLPLKSTSQVEAISTILRNPLTQEMDFLFYFDRLAALLVERAMDNLRFTPCEVETPQGQKYAGLHPAGAVSAVVILRGGSCLETGLRRVIPDCQTGRLLIMTNFRTGEPELHYQKVAADISTHNNVLLLDSQMSSGGAALMAVRVLIDHGVPEDRIVFVTYSAGRMGVNRLTKVYPSIRVVVCKVVDDFEERWLEKRYFGC